MNAITRTVQFACVFAALFYSWAWADPPVDREFDTEGYHVRVNRAKQVIGIDIPEDRGLGGSHGGSRTEAPVSPTIPLDRNGLISGSVLAQKAKQFDDGLYAAVDLAAQAGVGRFRGKSSLLEALARALTSEESVGKGNAESVVLAACRLGQLTVTVSPDLKPAVELAVRNFLADELRSKPIGFYTWSSPLRAIFQQDRMLASELEGAAGIGRVVRALHADRAARSAYESYLALVSRLTNPLVAHDLRGPLRALDEGRTELPDKGLAFFPPSRSHETDLVKKLYGNRPIPEGFSLVDEMVRRIRGGGLNLLPTPESGWYDYQTWALEPLAAPERTSEAARLRLGEAYRKQLLELFKGVLALTRETHIKQLEIPAVADAMARPAQRPVTILIEPELSVEPLATHYARRASSYRFVRSVLEKTFGVEALRKMHRQTAAGPVKTDLATELDKMIVLFSGASAAVGQELGLAGPVLIPPASARPHSENADRDAFRRWSRTLRDDPDLGRDVRMMVPVFFDRHRSRTKVWVFLGWSQRPVRCWFATPPVVTVTKDGRPPKPGAVEVEFGGLYDSLVYPVTAEVYVGRILNRDEFHRHCDRFKTRSAILKNLN
jgi:hypothetical protein